VQELQESSHLCRLPFRYLRISSFLIDDMHKSNIPRSLKRIIFHIEALLFFVKELCRGFNFLLIYAIAFLGGGGKEGHTLLLICLEFTIKLPEENFAFLRRANVSRTHRRGHAF